MSLPSEIDRYYRIFKTSTPLTTASMAAQDAHADHVTEWLVLTSKFDTLSKCKKSYIEQTLLAAQNSATELYRIGDDISAWLGQMRIAEASEALTPGPVAADQLASAAALSCPLLLHV